MLYPGEVEGGDEPLDGELGFFNDDWGCFEQEPGVEPLEEEGDMFMCCCDIA